MASRYKDYSTRALTFLISIGILLFCMPNNVSASPKAEILPNFLMPSLPLFMLGLCAISVFFAGWYMARRGANLGSDHITESSEESDEETSAKSANKPGQNQPAHHNVHNSDNNFIKTLISRAEKNNRKNMKTDRRIRLFKEMKHPLPPILQEEEDFANFSDNLIAELLHLAIERNRIDIFIQPIVSIPQRHIMAFEFYGRLRAKPGLYIPATKYKNIARQEGLLSHIDNNVLVKSLETMRLEIEKNIKTGDLKNYFLNITGATLSDTTFMHTLLQFLGRHKNLASLLVFEITENEFLDLPDRNREILKGLAQIGCKFSLSNLKKGVYDCTELSKFGIAYLRLPSDMFAEKEMKDHVVNDISKNIKMFREAGIEIIADYVENNETLSEVMEYPVTLAQGFLFGKPDTPGVYNIRLAA